MRWPWELESDRREIGAYAEARGAAAQMASVENATQRVVVVVDGRCCSHALPLGCRGSRCRRLDDGAEEERGRKSEGAGTGAGQGRTRRGRLGGWVRATGESQHPSFYSLIPAVPLFVRADCLGPLPAELPSVRLSPMAARPRRHTNNKPGPSSQLHD